MEIKIIYEDADVMVTDKPAGIVVFCEAPAETQRAKEGQTYLIDELIKKYPNLVDVGRPPRYGIVHRLDKDTSGVLLVAKTNEALIFLQKQFKNREVEKKYLCLVEGDVKNASGIIETLIARGKKDPRKQKAYSAIDAPKSAREAITEYKVLQRYVGSPTSLKLRGVTSSEFTLLEVKIKTGRRHQIRCHFSYLKHPIAGDKLYGSKNSIIPEGLTRQFLHSACLRIQLPSGENKEFLSKIPEELQSILKKLKT